MDDINQLLYREAEKLLEGYEEFIEPVVESYLKTLTKNALTSHLENAKERICIFLFSDQIPVTDQKLKIEWGSMQLKMSSELCFIYL